MHAMEGGESDELMKGLHHKEEGHRRVGGSDSCVVCHWQRSSVRQIVVNIAAASVPYLVANGNSLAYQYIITLGETMSEVPRVGTALHIIGHRRSWMQHR